ncbi:TPA: hypothetical protein ACVO0N_004199 [Vibrio diabolicus]
MKKTTKSIKYSVLGWFLFFVSMLLGMSDLTNLALIGFLFSYLTLFLWSVFYEKDQLEKGTIMILSGVFFVVALGGAASLDNESTIKLFSVPDNLKAAYVALLSIASATFLGAGGSVVANVASVNSTDNKEFISRENALSLNRTEEQLATIQRLLKYTIIGIIGLILIVFCIGVYIGTVI